MVLWNLYYQFPTAVMHFQHKDFQLFPTRILNIFLYTIVPSLIFLVLILLRFSRENKAKISFILGLVGLLYLTLAWLDRYSPLVYKLAFGIQVLSVLGLTYGIFGLKSSKKNLALIGIILNIAQFSTLLIPRYIY